MSKTVMKNILDKEDCLEVVPAVPILNRNVNTVAGRKLVYQKRRNGDQSLLKCGMTAMMTM